LGGLIFAFQESMAAMLQIHNRHVLSRNVLCAVHSIINYKVVEQIDGSILFCKVCKISVNYAKKQNYKRLVTSKMWFFFFKITSVYHFLIFILFYPFISKKGKVWLK
ncbi:hypothetical protein L9F63_010277, partial [Diploptera punctata]